MIAITRICTFLLLGFSFLIGKNRVESASEPAVLKFTRTAENEHWDGPYDVLRDIGADLRSLENDDGISKPEQQPTPEDLFPIDHLPAFENKRDRELLFFGCERLCLFGCRCDGYECKRGGNNNNDNEEARRYLANLLNGREVDEIEEKELEEIEEKALADWQETVANKNNRDLLLFGLFGRCTRTPKTCEITNNQNCGECAPRDFFTASETESTYNICYYYSQCKTSLAPADCAVATDNCFLDKCKDDNEGNGCYVYLSTVDATEQCGPYEPKQRNRRLGKEEHDDDTEENESQDVLPAPKDKSLMGFVRIPKTGSTTMMNFLDYAHRMYSWDMHLPDPDDSTKSESVSIRKKNRKTMRVAGCIFGYAARKAHLGSGRTKKAAKKFWNRCPHLPYGVLAERWVQSLSLWSPPLSSSDVAMQAEVQEDDDDSLLYTMTLNAFTMVRDPFDRLVSYFYYLRKFTETNQFLKHTATEAQYERVKANDIEGWMELLHTEDGGRGLELPYQYKYVHQDVDYAIKLIQQQGSAAAAPQVLVLLTECYEASLHLLVDSFCCFEKDFVQDFVRSEDYMSNSNEASYDEDRSSSALSLKLLREKAEVWFADDYRFYDAAVQHFQQALAQSAIGKKDLATCPYWSGSR